MRIFVTGTRGIPGIPGGVERHCEELDLLTRMLDRLKNRKPKTEADRLKEDLDSAIALEDYERAADLRDAIKKMQQEQMIP